MCFFFFSFFQLSHWNTSHLAPTPSNLITASKGHSSHSRTGQWTTGQDGISYKVLYRSYVKRKPLQMNSQYFYRPNITILHTYQLLVERLLELRNIEYVTRYIYLTSTFKVKRAKMRMQLDYDLLEVEASMNCFSVSSSEWQIAGILFLSVILLH